MTRKYNWIISFPLLLSLSSCAWMSRHMNDGEEDTEMVPKAQYDALMTKFTELEKKIQAPSPVAAPKADASDLVNELEKSAMKDTESLEAKNTLMETVDVFDTKGSASSVVSPNLPGKTGFSEDTMADGSTGSVDSEISELKKAMSLAGLGKYDQATKILQNLSKSSGNKQIQVRAKFGSGEVFLAQKEYDLALQVYEDIINHNVYSGLVLNALKRAVTCSEKLNLTEKKARYESLLKDVFGS